MAFTPAFTSSPPSVSISFFRWARRCAGDQLIHKPLMIPFEMVVRDVFMYRSPEMMLAQGNDPVEAFFFD